MEQSVYKFGKEMLGYDDNRLNYIGEKEITVTITLAEYRRLVEEVACKKLHIEKANSDKYSRESENKRLIEENNTLKAELYELTKDCEDGGNRNV